MNARILEPFQEPIVSLFECCYNPEPIKEIPLKAFLFPSKPRDRVEAYRATEEEKLREEIKLSIRCVTPSGTFIQRRAPDLIKHTGLICIDIDAKHNPKIDLPGSKHILGNHLPSLYYAGLSLGGEGIFLLFRISHPEFHAQHFAAIADELEKRFDLTVDRAVKSVAHLRVASYDTDPYYNPNPLPYEKVMDTDRRSAQTVRTVKDSHNTRNCVEKAVAIIMEKRIDITKQYEHWFKIGCALAHEFGEEGRYWFHMVSRIHKNYCEPDCDSQYNRCLKYKIESGTKIATFFYYCKINGVAYWKE